MHLLLLIGNSIYQFYKEECAKIPTYTRGSVGLASGLVIRLASAASILFLSIKEATCVHKYHAPTHRE